MLLRCLKHYRESCAARPDIQAGAPRIRNSTGKGVREPGFLSSGVRPALRDLLAPEHVEP